MENKKIMSIRIPMGIGSIISTMLLVIGISTVIQGVIFIDSSQIFLPRAFGGFVIFSGIMLLFSGFVCLNLSKVIRFQNHALAENIKMNNEIRKILNDHKQ